MAFKIPEAMLRAIKLTPDETQMIIEEAEAIISETLAVNECFIVSNRHLPKRKWKLVRSKEKVEVFQTRKEKKSASTACPITNALAGMGRSTSPSDISSEGRPRSMTSGGHSSQRSAATSSCSDSSGSSDSTGSGALCNTGDLTAVINKSKPIDTPLVIATGIISGTVDDVAFGNLAYTERLTRYRDAHLQDEYAGIKILATILRPTAEDPFQSLVVKWSTKSVGALSRMRDCVYIEANGVATDSRGERVAYSLVHSLDCIPRIPGFKHLDIVRVNMSTCYISRQYDQSSIEVFCRGFADPGGQFADTIIRGGFADMVLSIVHVVDCAYVKKLIALAHKKHSSSSSSSSCSKPTKPSPTHKPASHCAVCSTNLTKLGSLLHTSAACRCCRQEICSKCSVAKKIAAEASSMEMKSKSVTYCLQCVIEAKQSSASEAAIMMMRILDPGWERAQGYSATR